MDQKFFIKPFAKNGDTTQIPDTDDDGYVNYDDGWGEDYEKNLATDANAKPVGRSEMNALFHDITESIGQYQRSGFPEYITPAENNGFAYAYSLGSCVVRDKKYYVSTTDNNTAVPGTDTKWQQYIFKESSATESVSASNDTTIMTPRRVNSRISALRNEFAEKMGSNQQVSVVKVDSDGSTSVIVPVDCDKILLTGYGYARGVETRSRLTMEVYLGGYLVATRTFDGWTSGSSGLGHLRLVDLSYCEMINRGYKAGTSLSLRFSSGWGMEHGWNISLFYLKTNSDPGDGKPSDILISPENVTLNAGTTQHFTSSILPSSLEGDFPVTWSVSDASLGSINAMGMYSATQDKSGMQTVIASISTGMAKTATITQLIYLTSMNIGVVPLLTVGDSRQLAITYAPTDFTEPVLYSSSDTSILSAYNDGFIEAVGAGSATITATGVYSGVSVSTSVVVNPLVIPEKYFQIDNQLSEISTEENQEKARTNLGLGALSTKNQLTSSDVNAVHLSPDTIAANADLNTITNPGQYFQDVSSNATAALHYPEVTAGALLVYKTGVDEGSCRQEYMPYNSTDTYKRYGFGSPLVFSEWQKY